LQFQSEALILQGMNRSAGHYLRELLELFPVVAILGPRQCGKTTLLHEVTDNSWHFFDLERRADRGRIEVDPDLPNSAKAASGFGAKRPGPLAV
jgi:predicted AAA+ superfamily ATPase